MKILSSKAHGVIDYLLVAFLLLSPTIFKMEGDLRTITYALGAAHLLITILTDFEVGVFKVIPFRIHGLIEIVVALALGGLAFWFNSNGSDLGFYFFSLLAVAVLLVFVLTDFKSAPSRRLGEAS